MNLGQRTPACCCPKLGTTAGGGWYACILQAAWRGPQFPKNLVAKRQCQCCQEVRTGEVGREARVAIVGAPARNLEELSAGTGLCH